MGGHIGLRPGTIGAAVGVSAHGHGFRPSGSLHNEIISSGAAFVP
jgi:hypothetical protein